MPAARRRRGEVPGRAGVQGAMGTRWTQIATLGVLVAGVAGFVWYLDRWRVTEPAPPAPPAPAEGPLPAEAPPALPPAAAVAPLAGRVVAFDDSPAPGATVTAILLGDDLWPVATPGVRPPVAAAGSDGRFSFPDLPAGVYLLDARAGDARGYHPAVDVGGEPRECVVRLLEAGAIAGHVLGDDGRGVEGAVVTTDAGDLLRPFFRAIPGRLESVSIERFEARTDAAGAFRLGPLPAGLYDLVIRADGRETRLVPFVACPVDGIAIRLLDAFAAVGPGLPGADLRVRTDPPAEAEAEDGRITLRGLVPGRYRVFADTADGGTVRGEVAVTAGRASPTIVWDHERGARVRGFVLDEAGARIGRAAVAFFRLRALSGAGFVPDGQICRLSAGPKGDFAADLPAGLWCAAARPGEAAGPWPIELGYGPDAADVLLLTEGEPLTVHISPVPATPLFGRIVGPRDLGVGGALVVLEILDAAGRPRHRLETTSRPDGTFAFEGLSGGIRVRLRAVRRGAEIAVLDLAEWGPGPVLLRAPGPGAAALRGRVIDDSSRPVPGAFVLAGGLATETAVDGRFVLRGLGAGTVRLLAFALGAAPTEPREVTLAADDTLDLPDLVLWRRGVEVQGVVRDAAGDPVPGARVRVDFGGGLLAETRTAWDGSFSQRGPGTGENGADLLVTAAGFAAAPCHLRLEPLEERAEFVLARPAAVVGRLAGSARTRTVTLLLKSPGPPGPEPACWLPLTAAVRGGEFRVEDVPAGAHRLRLLGEDTTFAELGTVSIPAGGTFDAGEVTLAPGAVIRGRLDGPPGPARYLVGIRALDLWTPVRRPDGGFLLPGVPPGLHTVESFTGKHAGGSASVEVGPGPRPPLTVPR